MGLPERYSTSVHAPDVRKGARPVNPNIVLIVRFLITALICALSLATTIVCILVVVYYNSHDPIVRPSWGSLIFLIVLGFLTPIIYFGYNIFLPLMPFIHYGGFLYGLFMVKIELILQFAMCVLWVSGSLAYAADLRGRENCQFDGYLHYTEPADFEHVCDLINYAVPLAYATFGVQVLLFVIETAFAFYTFLFIDQESLSEPHFGWGRRAYDWYHSPVSRQYYNESNMYRARAVPSGSGRYARGGGTGSGSSISGSDGTYSSQQGGRGRRGAAYNDPEAASTEFTDDGSTTGRSLGSSELREEDEETEMTESNTQGGGPFTLGRRGRRGYADEETAEDDETDFRDEDTDRGWHLRQ